MTWTNELRTDVFQKWDAGLSAKQISQSLNGKKSRNAVMGFINRNQDLVSRKFGKTPQDKSANISHAVRARNAVLGASSGFEGKHTQIYDLATQGKSWEFIVGAVFPNGEKNKNQVTKWFSRTATAEQKGTRQAEVKRLRRENSQSEEKRKRKDRERKREQRAAIPKKPRVKSRKPKQKPVTLNLVDRAPRYVPATNEVMGLGISLTDFTKQTCKYPTSSVKPTQGHKHEFCGLDVEEGRGVPYCKYHADFCTTEARGHKFRKTVALRMEVVR